MNAPTTYEPRARTVALPGRGGAMALLDFGPADRAVDIVFSHANGFNARTYRTLLAPMAHRLRILALDLRGHGASTLPAVIEGRLGWNEFRDDLLALLACQADGPVVLAGHSMGGTTSLLAAAQAPERVSRLVLFEPVMFPQSAHPAGGADGPLVTGALRRRASFPSLEAAVEAYRGRGAFKTWSEAQLRDYVAGGFVRGEDGGVTLACTPAWEASNFRTHNYEPFDALARTRCPVAIFKGDHGSTTKLQASPHPDRVTLTTVAGASHFLPMERPQLFAEALLAAVS